MISRLLLCTDLDRTIIPNGTQSESTSARRLFSKLVSQPEVTLVYVTGRDKSLVEHAIASYQLPLPDYVIADVGATIYNLTGQQWHGWETWNAHIAKDWKGKTSNDLSELFADFNELRKQEVNKQKNFKLSYYVPLYVDYQRLIHAIQEKLLAAKLKAELIWSIDEPAGIGLLDIMSPHATKRQAIEFLMQEKQFEHSETLFAGDSGNDFDVLISPINSILVANAHDDVKKSVRDVLIQKSSLNTIYFATGGYREMNGFYSAGVLEGIHHFIPEIDAWFGE